MENNKERVLISGGAGFIGSELTKELLDRADELNIESVTVFDNLLYGQDNLAPLARNPKFRFVLGDVRDWDLLKEHIKNSTTIYPLAAIVGAPACKKNINAAGEINVDHIAFIAGNCPNNTKIIYPNTNSIFGASPDGICNEDSPKSILSHYAKTKQESEDIILDYGGISLRLSTVMGFSGRFRRDLLVNSFVLEALTNGYIVLSEANYMRSYVHILDVVSAMIHSLKNYNTLKCQAYNISSEDLSKTELCEKIKKYIPNFSIKQDNLIVDQDKRNYKIDSSKFRKTGWSPKYSVEDTIQELIRGYPILLNSGLNKYTNL